MPDLLASIPPGTEPETDVVTQKVFINGSLLSNEILLSQITVSKSFNKISYAKMVFLDGSASDRNFPLSNDDKFKPGNTVKIQLGYHGEVDTVFEGIIIKHGIKVRQQASSLLTIEAKDKAIKLTIARKSKYFIDKTDSDIIKEIAGGLTGDIDPTQPAYKQMVQFDTTDWDFIITRAEANGMFVLTDNGKINVKLPSTTETPVLTATYGDNIWDFEAQMDARKQLKKITGLSWDYTKQKIEESDPGSASFSENGNLSSVDLGEVLNAEIKLNHPGNLEEKQLQDWSDAYAMRNHLLKIVGRVRIQGNASIKPGNIVKLAGVGDRFNGNVFVTGVLHHFEGSWQTDIQFGWREDWFFKKEDVMNKPASGLLPGINGLQIGLVLDVDDNEDGGQYRIKVHVPVITSGNEGIWARVATLDAGDNRGVYFRPQQNDEVVLGFLNDDPREVIVLGYLHSKDSKKSPLPEDEGKLQYGFVTQEKMKLIFDDSNKRVRLIATTPSGEKSIIMNDDSGAFIMTDENQNTIKMDASGITIQSAKNVTIKGLQVMIN
ncbi:MAG: type VI secretion system tip protein VgrG [Ginsengibacter sp.]